MSAETLPPIPVVEPVAVDLTQPVQHVYPHPDGGVDVDTWRGHEEYLQKRFAGTANGQLSGGASPAGTVRVPTITPGRYIEHGWLASNNKYRRFVAAAALGTTLLANAANVMSLAKDAADAVRTGWHNISQLWGGTTRDMEYRVTRPVGERESTTTLTYNNKPSGEAAPDAADVRHLLTVLQSGDQGAVPTEITIEGHASDEYHGPESLGVPDAANQKLAHDRAERFKAALEQTAAEEGVKLPPITVASSEDTLSTGPQGEVDQLYDTLEEYGWTFEDAKVAHKEAPQTLPPALRQTMDDLLGSARGLVAKVQFKTPAHTQISPVMRGTLTEAAPANETQSYDPNLWPLLSLLAIGAPRLRFGRGKPGFVTEASNEEVPRRTWVKLYPEGVVHAPEALQLSEDPWACTRKYQLLMRENRIMTVQRYDYTDARGNAQSFRALYVDHEPTPDMLAATEELFARASIILDGGLPNHINTLAVYPWSSADHAHNDPSRVGVGIDEQYDHVLGIAIPTLRLAEVYAQEKLHGFPSTIGTAAHELAGHGSDLDPSRPVVVRQVGVSGRRLYEMDAPVANRGKAAFAQHPPLQGSNDLKFLAERTVRAGGEVTTVREEMNAYDPRLADASRVWLLGHKPTRYSGKSPSEYHAELAKLVIGEVRIPLGHANVWANGSYEADPEQVRRYVESVGGKIDASGAIVWPTQPNGVAIHGPIDDDPVLGPIARRARLTPLPPEDQLVSMLAGQSGSGH